MTTPPIGLISSAATETLVDDRRTESVPTPWGDAQVVLGRVAGCETAIILRYGPAITLPSHRINYRANIWALKLLGVQSIISQNAIGSVSPDIHPGDIVVPDDFLDRTKSRPLSLFDDGDCWVRVDLSRPFCPRLRDVLIAKGREHSDRILDRGVFVCSEGPRFETPAEIRSFQREGGDVVGTPLVPEIVFAREAEMCFASLSPVINYGAGLSPAVVHFGPGSMNETYYEGGLHDTVESILASTISSVTEEGGCDCHTALKGSFHGSPPDWYRRNWEGKPGSSRADG